jgi:glutaredoxin 3
MVFVPKTKGSLVISFILFWVSSAMPAVVARGGNRMEASLLSSWILPPPSMRRATSTTSSLYLMDFVNVGKNFVVQKLAGEYDEKAVRQRIDQLIDANPVLMLSFTTCPFCIRAKQVLDANKATYSVVELDQDPDGKAIRAVMGDMLGRTSVPAIWINRQFIGGCNDGPLGGIVKLDESGKLGGMLREVGAIL